MKAYFINTHLLVPRSWSSAKVKVKYQGHVSQTVGVVGALCFTNTSCFIRFKGPKSGAQEWVNKAVLTLFNTILTYNNPEKPFENTVGKEDAGDQHFLFFPQCCLKLPTNPITFCCNYVVCICFEFEPVKIFTCG